MVNEMKVDGILEKKNDNHKFDLSKTIILGLVGLVFIFMPLTLNSILGIIVGILLFIVGSLNIYNYIQNKNLTAINLISGILFFALGFIIVLNPVSVMNLVARCLGVYLLMCGIIKIRLAISIRKISTMWSATLISAIIISLLGILLIVSPFRGLNITRFAGYLLIVTSLIDIFDTYYFQKK